MADAGRQVFDIQQQDRTSDAPLVYFHPGTGWRQIDITDITVVVWQEVDILVDSRGFMPVNVRIFSIKPGGAMSLSLNKVNPNKINIVEH